MDIALEHFTLKASGPLFVIAGPCVLEDDTTPLVIGREMRDICAGLGLPYIFKASYDKANRTSHASFRGPGIDEGLAQLAAIRKELRCPVLTDVHSPEEALQAGETVDIVQVPAFLCRQTDLIIAAAQSGACVNVKKGQFLAPWDARNIVEKLKEYHAKGMMLTERGASFGYNNLVVDMRSIPIMRDFGAPVVFDCTHSVQQPGGLGKTSGGNSEHAPWLARAAVAVGCDGLFAETHTDPSKAKSDGPNMIPLKDMPALLAMLKRVRAAIGRT